MPTEKRPPIDWEAIHREYLAGQLSIHEIGRQYGVSHVAIIKRAKKLGWERNLAARVKAGVTARLVTDDVTAETKDEIVEAAVKRSVEVVRQHRQDIGKFTHIVRRLAEQLEDALENRDEIEEAIGEETASDPNSQRRSRMLRAVSLGEHAGIMKDLSGSAKTLIDLERQAFGISDGSGDAPATGGDVDYADLARRFAFLLARGAAAVKQNGS